MGNIQPNMKLKPLHNNIRFLPFKQKYDHECYLKYAHLIRCTFLEYMITSLRYWYGIQSLGIVFVIGSVNVQLLNAHIFYIKSSPVNSCRIFSPIKFSKTHIFMLFSAKEQDKEVEHIPTPENTPDCGSNPLMTPKPVRALIYGERGESSVVKYKITATPGYVRVIVSFSPCYCSLMYLFGRSKFFSISSALICLMTEPMSCKLLRL